MKKILDDEFYNLKEIAEILGISRKAVHDYVKKGKIRGKKIGREWYFTKKDIKAYLDKKTPPPGSIEESLEDMSV